jgi:hypothetical protein
MRTTSVAKASNCPTAIASSCRLRLLFASSSAPSLTCCCCIIAKQVERLPGLVLITRLLLLARCLLLL